MSVPRSCCFLSWFFSMVSRMSSSVTLNSDHGFHDVLVVDRLHLLLAEALQALGLGRVVAVTVDDHGSRRMLFEGFQAGRRRIRTTKSHLLSTVTPARRLARLRPLTIPVRRFRADIAIKRKAWLIFRVSTASSGTRRGPAGLHLLFSHRRQRRRQYLRLEIRRRRVRDGTPALRHRRLPACTAIHAQPAATGDRRHARPGRHAAGAHSGQRHARRRSGRPSRCSTPAPMAWCGRIFRALMKPTAPSPPAAIRA